MKLAGRIALLVVMLSLAAAAAWGAIGTIRMTKPQVPAEVYALYQAKSGRAGYLLRMTDIETALLRRADRAMLEKGIPAEDLAEVLALLEDLGS